MPGLHHAGVQLLFGSVVSCQDSHSFVPPHSVPFRQFGGGASGLVDPLTVFGWVAWWERPLAASAVFRKHHAPCWS